MRKRGFTLIELLIVIAIIAILALIAIPNFLEAQTRAKVSRVMGDERSVATAIEAYSVDWTRYPSYMNWLDRLGTSDQYETYVPLTLTTPVAFLTTLLKDPFRVQASGTDEAWPFIYRHAIDEGSNGTWDADGTNVDNTYGTNLQIHRFRLVAGDYFKNAPGEESEYSGKVWFLSSMGPDLRAQVLDRLKDGTSADPAFKYDPTNGTVSDGEVMRWGP